MSSKINNEFYKWKKIDVIKNKIENNRSLNWYKENYRKNLNISLGFVLLSFVIVSFACYKIKLTSDDRQLFITSTSGGVVHYKMTDEKRRLLLNALEEINKNGNR